MDKGSKVLQKKKQNKTFSKSQSLKTLVEPYAYLLPCMVLLSAFIYYPFFKTVILSFFMTDTMGRAVQFVMLDNYIKIVKSPDFINSCIVTVKFVCMTTLTTILLSFIMMLLTEERIKGNRAFEALFTMPIVISSSAGCLLWMLLCNTSTGIVNYIIGERINWFLDKRYALFSVCVVTTWLSAGINYIFFLSGIRNIPKEIMESAKIDGVCAFRRIIKIVIPLMSPTIFFIVFMDITVFFQVFTQFMILTKGGPEQSTNVLIYSIYKDAFINFRFDMAFTQSVVLFLIMFVFIMLQLSFEKKVVYSR